MSFTQIAIAASAVALLAPSASEACMQFSRRDKIIMGSIAAITSPLWIAPAIGYGIVVGIAKGVEKTVCAIENSGKPNSTSLAADNSPSYRERTEAVRPYFDEAEKNPTVVSLFRCGMHMISAEDFVTGRRFLKRAIELAKEQNPRGWDCDVKNLPVLALAQQQIGELQMQLHAFAEAYDSFVETARLADTLNSFSPDIKIVAGTEQQSTSDSDESFALLSQADLQHDIGWSLLHKALYTIDEMDPIVDDLLQSAVETLEKVRSTNAEYELHYAIARFYQAARGFKRDRPSAEDDGDDDPTSINWKHPYYTEAVPKFIADFGAKIAPLFDGIVHNKSNNTLNSGRFDAEVKTAVSTFANIYLARVLFVLDDVTGAEACLAAARKMLNPRGDRDEIALFGLDFRAVRENAGRGADDHERQFYRVELATTAAMLEPPSKDWRCGNAPHDWVQRKFHRPSTCQVCMKSISWVENRVGPFECRGCHFRCHKECKEKLGDDAICSAACSSDKMGTHQHILRKRTLHSPHFCSKCGSLIKNFFAAYGCESCGVLVHEDCAKNMRNALNVEKN